MKKHLKYLLYVLKHKYFVFLACLRYKVPIWTAIIHDLSKFSPIEWGPYVNYFYGEKNKYAFDVAWLHHQKTNPHHWQYWVLINDQEGIVPLEMPHVYVREMVAYWWGAGKAITGTGDPRGWYEKNWRNMYLHTKTRQYLEKILLLNVVDPKYYLYQSEYPLRSMSIEEMKRALMALEFNDLEFLNKQIDKIKPHHYAIVHNGKIIEEK